MPTSSRRKMASPRALLATGQVSILRPGIHVRLDSELNRTPTTPSTVCAITACLSQSRSTGKERDAESGLDYIDARYYASTMGRFMSPDPSQLYFADPTNPQSFNLYTYALK